MRYHKKFRHPSDQTASPVYPYASDYRRAVSYTHLLNFSDPWPKARHAKRRLTYRSFLEQYKNILADGGELIIKTDNDGFFEFSVSELTENGWILDSLTHDLHGSPYAADNVMTEYETAFSARGKNINYVRARLK